jgi:hypothetical protein
MLDAATTQQVAGAYEQEQNPELKSAWASVIGALGGTPQRAGDKLLAFPPPAAPLP